MSADSSAKVRNITIEKEQGGVVQLAHIPLQTPHGAQTETRKLSMTVRWIDVESSVAPLWIEHAVWKRGMDDADDAGVGLRNIENGVELNHNLLHGSSLELKKRIERTRRQLVLESEYGAQYPPQLLHHDWDSVLGICGAEDIHVQCIEL